MKSLISLALVAGLSLCAVQAQAVPVALHYDLRGTDFYYGPPGALGFSFDLYYDPTLLGDVASNGGLATNGYFFYQPQPIYGPSTGVAASGQLTSVTATISPISGFTYPQVPPGTVQVVVQGSAPGVNAYTGLYVTPTGGVVSNNFAYGVNVNVNGVSHFSEDQQVRVGPVPEAATWAMMMMGLGAVGGILRRRRNVTARLAYA